jgi:hypothetical protein
MLRAATARLICERAHSENLYTIKTLTTQRIFESFLCFSCKTHTSASRSLLAVGTLPSSESVHQDAQWGATYMEHVHFGPRVNVRLLLRHVSVTRLSQLPGSGCKQARQRRSWDGSWQAPGTRCCDGVAKSRQCGWYRNRSDGDVSVPVDEQQVRALAGLSM